eukprot:747579-Pelagomonas_calceolata.AAC.2
MCAHLAFSAKPATLVIPSFLLNLFNRPKIGNSAKHTARHRVGPPTCWEAAHILHDSEVCQSSARGRH